MSSVSIQTAAVPGVAARERAAAPIAELRREFLASLHGLRGLLAVWVLVFHVSATMPGASHGYLAVDVFFVLSGFVLMHTHAKDFAGVGWGNSASFIGRRFWRTIPLHAACLALAVIVFYLLRSSLPAPLRFLQSALLLEGWAAPGLDLNAPIWSLGVEWVGYLAFPLIAFTARRVRSTPALVVTIALLVVVELTVLIVAADRSWRWGTPNALEPIIRMAFGFVAGCLLWRVHDLREWSSSPSDVPMAIACLGIVVILWTASFATMALPFLVLLVHAAARPGAWSQRLLAHPVPMFLGRVSFSLYLSHFLIVMLAYRLQGSNPSLLVRAMASGGAYLAAFGTAVLLCLFVEEPGRRWRNARRRHL